ncbi:hypothetical protein [Sphingomonas oligophenolica]|uniref:Uncharacterized protein n=1 Tax=Sphingomonas oligophenolica TaxID=301154 RepID=A0A502CJ24_9SPHN|nr:hypothetical protein [Sphingomonas oligophenolica]TPG13635.1 hypothetical protein EAH84_05500 [Sphingomonas oligophenolica]
MFVLGDPAHGSHRHHKENAVLVSSYLEALELVRKGFAIRMSDGRSAPSLVAPGSLEFIVEPVNRLDDLWTYTMPEPPFSLEAVMVELKQHLRSQAADLGLIASGDAASAFIGFPFDPVDDGESSEALERIDLSRFNMTRIVTASYHSAFRPTAESRSISEDDVEELEQIMVGSLARFSRRHGSPLDREGSALQRTILSAYYRWKIADGCFLASEASDGKDGAIDQSVTEAVAALTGMPATAVRNTLSRDGLSVVRSKLDLPALTDWVVTRRNFSPLREEETYEGRWAWRIANDLHDQPGPTGFAKARSRIADPLPDLDEAEAAVMKRRASNEMPTAAELRRYALALHVSPDSLFSALQTLFGRR